MFVHSPRASRRLAPRAVVAIALLIGGCATVPTDHGGLEVAELTRHRTDVDIGPDLARWPRDASEDAEIRRSVDESLDKALAADDAVRVALLNNPGLQAEYAQLGFAAADLVAASRPANPGFSFAKLRSGNGREIDRTVTFDVIGLLTAPLRYRVASNQREATQYGVAERAVRVALDARRSWVRAVAAEQSLVYFGQAREAAEAGAELGQRMEKAGNWPRLTAMREKSFHADAVNGYTRARALAVSTRERLARVMGIDDPSRIRLPERLPDLPSALRDTADAERVALDERLDVRAARSRLAATARGLGLTRVTRFIDVLDLGYKDNSFSQNRAEGPKQQGFEVSLEIPLFDFGTARALRTEALYRQSAALLRQTAIAAGSDVRLRVAAARDAFEIARRHRIEVVPLRKAIVDEMTLRYNAMLASVFELLAEAREQMDAVAATIDAERDYWLADADLQFSLTTGSTLSEGAR